MTNPHGRAFFKYTLSRDESIPSNIVYIFRIDGRAKRCGLKRQKRTSSVDDRVTLKRQVENSKFIESGYWVLSIEARWSWRVEVSSGFNSASDLVTCHGEDTEREKRIIFFISRLEAGCYGNRVSKLAIGVLAKKSEI